MERNTKRKQPDNFELSIDGFRVRLGGAGVAVIAGAIAAMLYAIASRGC